MINRDKHYHLVEHKLFLMYVEPAWQIRTSLTTKIGGRCTVPVSSQFSYTKALMFSDVLIKTQVNKRLNKSPHILCKPHYCTQFATRCTLWNLAQHGRLQKGFQNEQTTLFLAKGTIRHDTSVFSFLRQLSTWHCSHLLIHCLAPSSRCYWLTSPAHTTLSSKLSTHHGFGRMMRQTGRMADAQLFHKPCSAYYESSANNDEYVADTYTGIVVSFRGCSMPVVVWQPCTTTRSGM